ncbi:MAG: hypothetical protein HY320_07055 [Armatimonadetes bacterium]|nr:hypothetical protein [Armatimonadota bacterium]
MQLRLVMLLSALTLAAASGGARADHRSTFLDGRLRGHLGGARFDLRFGRFHHPGFFTPIFTPVVIPPPLFYYPSLFYPPPCPVYERFTPPPLVIVLDADHRAPEPDYRYERPAPPPMVHPPLSGLERLRRDLVAEKAEPEVYFVRWREPAPDVLRVEYEVQDSERHTLSAQSVDQPPFRALVRLPAEAASVIVTACFRDGSSVAMRVPVAEFRRLGGS